MRVTTWCGQVCYDIVVYNTNLRKEVGMIVVAKPVGAVSVFTKGELQGVLCDLPPYTYIYSA